jgi:hypothetical protein
MQKFVTIHVHSHAYNKGLFQGAADAHGVVEEHLSQELADGWRVAQVAGIGGIAEFGVHAGWFAVVLEKP